MDLLPLSALSVFLAIAAVGFLFLVVALIFGELFEFFDHDVDMDHGPGILSTRVIAVFITTFGGIGALGVHYGLSTGVASALGAISGLVLGAAMATLGRFLYNQQSTSEVRNDDLVGQTCRVTVGIPANGIGQVRCRIGEELVDKIAQGRDGAAIPENASVQVETVLGETVIVRKL
jgi:membrane protein implicated in regulation of membrane protease activity